MYPKVSLLWINYNSSKFKDVIKESLLSIQNIDYPNIEFIAVDGGSTDDSPNYIEDLLRKLKINYKFVKQRKNLGLHSSWNVAYSTMSRKSKYFMLLNNDVVIYPTALKEFVKRLERDEKIGALNGIEFRWGSKIVDHAGMMFDELFTTNPLAQGLTIEECEKKEHVISVASSVLGIYRVSAIKKLGTPLLEENMFRHFNETVLGARLWTMGYKILYAPIKVGEHRTRLIKESRSFERVYYATRGWLTLLLISNSPYKNSFLRNSFLLKQLMNRVMKDFDFRNYDKAITYYRKVLADAKEKSENLIRRKITVDIYKIPHIKGFRYYWILPRGLTKIVQPTKTFTDLVRIRSLYIPNE